MKKSIYFILILTLIHVFLPFIFPVKHWEDYMITFNGSKLLLNNFEPYKDFGIPTGLGNFILTLLSFKILGVNYSSMYFVQAIEHLTIIYLGFRLLKSLKSDNENLLLFVYLILYNIHLIIKVKAPFYNSEFFIYEMLSVVFLLRFIYLNSLINLCISVIFCFLTIQTKQDFGMFNALIVSLVVMIHCWEYRTFKPVFGGLLTFFMCWVLFFIYVDLNNFIYWFRSGQIHQPSIHGFATILGQSNDILTGYFGLSSLTICLGICYSKEISKFEKYLLIIVLLLFLQNFVTLGLSHFPYLHYSLPLGVSFLIYIGYKYAKAYNLLIIGLIVLVVHPFVYSDLLFVRTFYDKQYFSGNYVKSSFEEMGNTVVLKEDNRRYKEIEAHILRLSKRFGRKIKIFNGELMPFNSIAKTTIHKGLPLWYDESVLLYSREKS